jgi:hypothetical protein
VTTDQLLKILNKDALRLELRPISRRMLRDWVDEGLISRRKAKGRGRGRHPIWLFSATEVRLARRIVKLKAERIRRVSEIRLHLWVTEDNYSIDRIGDAVRSEFVRVLQRDRRKQRLKYDHRHQRSLSEKDEQRYSKQLPPLDSGLAEAGFKIGPRATLDIISELLWGKAKREVLPERIAEEAERIFGKPVDQLAPSYFGNLAGLFGARDEIAHSGEEELSKANNADLLTARQKLHDLISALSLGARGGKRITKTAARQYRRAIASFRTTDWLVSTLAAFTLQAFRELACCRFRGHRVRCFGGTGGVSWSDGSLHESSSLRLCG